MGVTGLSPSAPAPLTTDHDLSSSQCGNHVLDDWLRKRALPNQVSNALRTFVICIDRTTVIGYYSLATGSIARSLTPGSVRQNMPEHVPVIVLGRLAIDRNSQGSGLGRALLRDATRRVLGVSREVVVRALLVHAIDDGARRFYLNNGFLESPMQSMTLLLPIATIASALEP
jgi:GNAT superfamily N-acetyltransferase